MTARRPFSAISMLIAALVCGLAAFPAHAAKGEPRIALVFGNSSYKSSPLRNPSNDAKLVAASLRATGFDVILKTDATRRDMRRAMIDFGRKLKDGGVGLFYYAGHGISVGGENYLIPVDAEIEVEDHVPVESVALNQVLARMGGARNRLNIVILDACRNNPFARSFRSGSRGLSQTLAPSGTYIAYATAPGDVAEDGEGKNSVYSQALARAVKEPGVKIEDVFKDVRRRVSGSTKGRQVPWTSSSITGDFFFTQPKPVEPPKQVAALPPPQPAGPTKETLELAFWESIKDSRNPSDFEAYLGQFPRGVFAGLARSKIASLKQAKADEKSRLEAELAKARAEAKAKEEALAQARAQALKAQTRSQQLAALPPPAAPAAQVPGGRLRSDQIKARLSGQVAIGRHSGLTVRVRFKTDGTTAAKIEDAQRTIGDTGTWSVGGDGVLCTQWRRLKEGKRRCFHISEDGPDALRFALIGGDEVQRYVVRAPSNSGTGNLAGVLRGKRIRFYRNSDDREIELWLGNGDQATLSVSNLIGTTMFPRDTGRWWVAPGNRLCFQFTKGMDGRQICSFIEVKGNEIAAKSPVDGSVRPWKFY